MHAQTSRLTVLRSALLLVALAVGLVACDGTGSKPTPPDEPIEISSLEELQRIGQRQALPLDGEYVLTDDIDASGKNGRDDGGGFHPIGQGEEPFTGRFDGNGHSLVGLSLVGDSLEVETLGLFGGVEGAVIQNLRLEEVSIKGGNPAGMLVGRSQSSDILNVQVSGRMTSARRAGGVVGENQGGTIENAEARGTIQKSAFGIGGLVGINVGGGTVRFSTSSVDLNGVEDRAGGLVGINGATTPGTISESVATGDIATGDAAEGGGIGGLVGVNNAHVEDSRATGTVTATGTEAGGLVALNNGIIRGSSAHGDVEVREVEGDPGGVVGDAGGLVARNAGGTIRQCSASGDVTLEAVSSSKANTDIGGLVGEVNVGSATVEESKATGSVSTTGDASRVNAGGLVGAVYLGSVSASYATGRVGGVATENAGGLVGKMLEGSLRQSFAAGAAVLAVEREGGVIGENTGDGDASALFWDVDQTNQNKAVGGGKEVEATGLTTSEMRGERVEANMAGFDFDDTWQTVPGDYPALFWEER